MKEQGGLLELISREVEIECLPDDIPEMFVVDVTNLMLGQNFRAGELAADRFREADQLQPITVIAHVVTIKGVEEAEAAAPVAGAVAAPAEPEVIKKGKKEEEAAPEEKGKKK